MLPLFKLFFSFRAFETTQNTVTLVPEIHLSSQKLTPVGLGGERDVRAAPQMGSGWQGPLGLGLSSVTCFLCTVGQVGAGESCWGGSCRGRSSFALLTAPVCLGAAVSAARLRVGRQQRRGGKDRRGGGGDGFGAIFCSQQNTCTGKGKEMSPSQKTNWYQLCTTLPCLLQDLESAPSLKRPHWFAFPQHLPPLGAEVPEE